MKTTEYIPTDLIADPNKLQVACTLTVETPDRSGDLVIVSGVDLTNHERVPVALLEHSLPVALAMVDGQYTVKRLTDRIVAVSQFDQNNPLSIQTFQTIESGLLRGVSIGMIPKSVELIPTAIDEIVNIDGDRVPRAKLGLRFNSVEMVEYSHCVLGDHQDALTVLVQKSYIGAEPLHPVLKALLSPYVIKAKEMVSMPEEYAPLPEEKAVEPVAPEPVVEEEKSDPVPPGSALLDGLYSRFLEIVDFLGSEGSTKKQENPEVLAFVENMLENLNSVVDEISAAHDALYPDVKSLSAPLDDEEPSEVEPDESNEKKLRRVFAKRIQAYRKSRVGFAPLTREDKVSQEELAALRSQLERIEKAHMKLVKEYRAAKAGR